MWVNVECMKVTKFIILKHVICTDVFWYPFSFIKYQTEFADVHSRFEVHAYSYCEASSGDCIW